MLTIPLEPLMGILQAQGHEGELKIIIHCHEKSFLNVIVANAYLVKLGSTPSWYDKSDKIGTRYLSSMLDSFNFRLSTITFYFCLPSVSSFLWTIYAGDD